MKKYVKPRVIKLNEQLLLEKYIKDNINNYTGIRLSEVFCLKIENFDFENETVQRMRFYQNKVIYKYPKSEASKIDLPLPSFIK